MNTQPRDDEFVEEPMTDELVYQLEAETRGGLGQEAFTTVEWFADEDFVTVTTTRGAHARAVVLRLGTKIETVTRLYMDDELVEWSFKIPKTMIVERNGKARQKTVFRGFQAIVPQLRGVELVTTKSAALAESLGKSPGRDNPEAALTWFANEDYFELVTGRGTFLKHFLLRIGDLAEVVDTKMERNPDGTPSNTPMEWTLRVPLVAKLPSGRTCKLFRSLRMLFPDVGGVDRTRFEVLDGEDDDADDEDDDE